MGTGCRYSTFRETVGAEGVSINGIRAAPVDSSMAVAMIPPWTLPKGFAISGVGVQDISAFPSCDERNCHRPGLSAYGAGMGVARSFIGQGDDTHTARSVF